LFVSSGRPERDRFFSPCRGWAIFDFRGLLGLPRREVDVLFFACGLIAMAKNNLNHGAFVYKTERRSLPASRNKK
jgi:hypothetical protein